MLDKLEIIKENNEKLSVDIISMFQTNVDGIDKKYCLITANEIDQNGLVKIHVAELLNDKLVKIVKDNEWIVVKNVMRSIISGSGSDDFSYINIPGPFKASNDFSRVVAVKDDAKNQLIKDYLDHKPEVAVKEDVKSSSLEEEIPANIYPTENESISIGSEIVPGIMENKEVEPKEGDLSTNNFTNPVEESVSVDVAVEENSSSTSVNVNPTDALEVLKAKIMAAVKEYIEATRSDDNKDEVERLKQELAEKEKKLASITSLINGA